jgi:hypothetical protein
MFFLVSPGNEQSTQQRSDDERHEWIHQQESASACAP